MAGFGEAEGRPIEWVDTRIETGFSNFVYVDHHFHSSPVLRRIFSIARKLGFQSVLLEEISETHNSLLARENLALSERCPTFTDALLLRACFFRSGRDQTPDDQKGDCLGYVAFKIDRFSIGLLRSGSQINAVEAEAIGLNFCNALAQTLASQKAGWLGRFAAFAHSGLLVLRTLLLRREEYIEHLTDARCWDGGAHDSLTVSTIGNQLPDTFWIVEASAPELFSASRRKFGEVLLNAETRSTDAAGQDLWLAARLPGTILLRGKTGFQAINSGTSSHVPLYQFSPPKSAQATL